MTRKDRLVRALCLTAATLWSTSYAAAQQVTYNDLEQIRREVKELRDIVEQLANGQARRQPPSRDDVKVTVPITDGPYLGRSDAPITIVEFTDLQCPFCRQFHETTFKSIEERYINTGQVRFISRDFPLTQLHPLASKSAVAARCAGEQNVESFWRMRRLIFANGAHIGANNFEILATSLGLSAKIFQACMKDEPRYLPVINADMDAGTRVGISGTPTFVIGRTSETNSLEGLKVVGAKPFSEFQTAIDALLSEIKQ